MNYESEGTPIMAAKTNEMLLTKEEVLMNEDDLLKGLLQAASFKNDVENYKLIQVKRNGKLLFQFRVRPLEESEIGECRKKATKYAPNPNNRNLPKVEVETDYIKLRAYKIYMATVDEDKPKTWDNKALMDKLDLLQNIEVIDSVLLAGEKDWICDIIDEISGYGVSREDYAKN